MSGSLLPNITRVNLGNPLYAPFGGGGGSYPADAVFSTVTVAQTTTLEGDLNGINANFGGGYVTVSTINCPQITTVSSINGAVYPPPAGAVPDPLGLNLLNVSTINQPTTGVLNVGTNTLINNGNVNTNTIQVSTINCDQAGAGVVNTSNLLAVNSKATGYSEGQQFLSTSGAVYCSTVNANFNVEDSVFPALNPSWTAGSVAIPAVSDVTVINSFPTTAGHTYQLSFECGFSNNNPAGLGVTQLYVNNGSANYYACTIPNLEADATYLNLYQTVTCTFVAGASAFTLVGSNTGAGQTTLLNNHSGECVLVDLGRVQY